MSSRYCRLSLQQVRSGSAQLPVRARAEVWSLSYDLAADVSGAARPSPAAAGLSFEPITLPHVHDATEVGWWVLLSVACVIGGFTVGGWRANRRFAAEKYFYQA